MVIRAEVVGEGETDCRETKELSVKMEIFCVLSWAVVNRCNTITKKSLNWTIKISAFYLMLIYFNKSIKNKIWMCRFRNYFKQPSRGDTNYDAYIHWIICSLKENEVDVSTGIRWFQDPCSPAARAPTSAKGWDSVPGEEVKSHEPRPRNKSRIWLAYGIYCHLCIFVHV